MRDSRKLSPPSASSSLILRIKSKMANRSSQQQQQPSPCEPCRKSKSRCDFATPVCKRCARKGKSAICVYNPAPSTQSWYATDAPPIASAPTQSSSDRLPESILKDRSGVREERLSQPRPQSLGLSSYSNVFSETDDNNNSDLGGLLQANGLNGFQASSSGPSAKQIEQGARLLVLLFENAPLLEIIIDGFQEASPEGCVLDHRLTRMIFTFVKEMYDWMRSVKNGTDVQASMRGWSQKIFDNTSKSVAINSNTTPEEYVSSMAARWEGIGLLFTVLGQGAMVAKDWRYFIAELQGNAPSNQKSLAALAAAASGQCLQFSDESGVEDDSLGWLLFQHIHLLILVYGDNDHRPWKKMSDLATIVFTIGRNQSKQTPFFLVELRRRLTAGAYSIDKQLATFHGRPPLISWRFYDVQIPLDLSEEDILADPHIRDAAMTKLDPSGWNTQGVVRKATLLRSAVLMGSTREQILELLLSRHVDNLPQKIKDVSQNSHLAWDDLPDFLRWSPSAGPSSDAVLPLYLNLLYNDFLLNRILVRNAQSGHEGLLTISQDILKLVLQLIARGIGSGSGAYNVGWNASTFGIPCAGTLAIELLRQTQSPSQFPSSTFRRAEIIQHLSIFSSHLQYIVRPYEGHYEVCQRARKTLSHILNCVLSGTAPALPIALPAGVIALDWLNGESIAMDDGSDFLEWIGGADELMV